MRIRVVTYNVRGFRDDHVALLEVVRELDPDVLVLNETGARWRLRRFARELTMSVAADPWSPLRRRAKDAVLVGPSWTIAEHRQRRFSRSAAFFPRAALFVRLEHGDVRCWVVAVHLGLRRTERMRHVGELLDELPHLDGPVVVAGDLNEHPDATPVLALRERLVDAWTVAGEGPGDTMPARAPTARIDDVFATRDIVVRRAFVPQGDAVMRASDHRPVAVDVEID